MSKVNFFTTLASMMENKESIDIKVQRTGEELTLLVIPKIGGKTATITMSGTSEELDEAFIEELNKPFVKMKGIVSNAADAKVTKIGEEEEEEDDEITEKVKQSTALEKEGDAFLKSKKYAESIAKYEEANAIGHISKTLLKSLEKAKAAYAKTTEGKAAAKAPKVDVTKTTETNANPQLNLEESAADIQKLENERRLATEAFSAYIDDYENLNFGIMPLPDYEILIMSASMKKQEAEDKVVADKAAFDEEMLAGDNAFKGREFLKAEIHYKAAVDLFPEDEKGKSELAKASKWVKQLREAGLLDPEEEKEGGNHGA